jgi:hypothetical protein
MATTQLTQNLIDYINTHYQGAEKDFIIHYGCFEINKDKINLKFAFTLTNEAYCSITKVEYSSSTEIKLYSNGYKCHTFTLKAMLTCRGSSNENNIYAIDLFPNYIPRNYKASVEIREIDYGNINIKN